MLVVCGGLIAAPAAAQTNVELWGNVTLNWLKSDRLTYEVDFEPKVLVVHPEDEPAWRNLDISPNVEYSLKSWLDLIAEGTVGFTKQTDDVDTIEATGRVGIRLHLFSRDAPVVVRARERPPKRRVVVRDLFRVEWRNLFSSDDAGESSSTTRFRNRLELLVPLNKPRLTDDGARYLMADWEWFVPVEEQQERFANKQRIRAGLGYRRNVAWRYEAVYIRTRSRDTIGEGFTTSENSLDLRLKRVF